MAHQNVWPRDSGVFQCRVYFLHSKSTGIFRTFIAPSRARVIVSANLSYCSDLWLNKAPIERISRAQNDDRGIARAYAVEVDSVTTYIHQLAERRRCLLSPTSRLC